ncbi:MAG: hypothetical protein N3D78_02065, partial [Candidatus Aenigmarchaeota archaeon]|nr:hypothetical protein [Candidatus Aenigmarchaeota archaeon]
GLVYDALAYTSCILAGKFPAEQGDMGWISFYIFYLILPFAFIFVLIHAIIGGIGLEGWLNENARRVITFIIAMYATRTMMGYFILQFVGYGAWGLGAIFVAIFLVGSLRNMIEGWFGIEKFGEETRKVIEDEIRWEREYATTAELIIKEAKGFAENNELTAAIQSLERLRNIPLWNRLDDEARRIVNSNLDRIRVLQDPRQFLKGLEDFEKVLKTWSHSKRI